MASVIEIKCPSCGVENGPCSVENGIPMFHHARKLAAYPTTYEHPECEECRKLKDWMVSAESSFRSCRPDYGTTKPKSRWPKAWKDELYTRENAANLARAKYELHLAVEHGEEMYKHSVEKNLTIVLREGRLRP